MTLITFQGGKPLMKEDGTIGAEQACCCGKCAVPCPDYCCPDNAPDFQYRPIPGFYSAGAPIAVTGFGDFDCNRSPQVLQQSDFGFYCTEGGEPADFIEGDLGQHGAMFEIVLELTANLVCDEIDADHPTEPGCGRNCRLTDVEVSFTGDTDAPCFDPTSVVFMVCPPC